MRKITKFITTLLIGIIMISFTPNEIANATEQKKNKNIENGSIYQLIQYEDNFVMEYTDAKGADRAVKKHGGTFSKYDKERYVQDIHSRYIRSGEDILVDLKDFSEKDISSKIEEVRLDLREKHSMAYADIHFDKLIGEKMVFDFWGYDNQDKTIWGKYVDGKVYIEKEEEEFNNYIVIGDKLIELKSEAKDYTTVWYFEIIDGNTGKKEKINLLETEYSGEYELEYIGNKVILMRNNEIIRYKYEKNKFVKIDSAYGKKLTIDKNGDIWGLERTTIIKYENGEKVVKKVLDKAYTNLFVYDENRIVVDNYNDYTINVLYSDVVKGEWKSIGGYYYYYENGVMQTGWKFIDGYYYYLNQDGTMQIGWLNINGAWYYLDYSGQMAEGYEEIDGLGYYFDKNTGRMQNNGWVFDIENYEYRYCQNNGVVFKGWLYLNNNYYYLNEEGVMAVGYYEIDDENYFFDYESGIMKTGWELTWQYDEEVNDYIDGYIYFSPSGAQIKGWQWIDNAYYYLDKTSGFMKTEWINLDGTYYYLGNNGAMRTGWEWINGAYYYLASGGQMLTGWQWIDGAYYYLASGGQMLTGWQWIDGAYYYLTSGGKMATGWKFIDNNWYYMYGSGVMATNTTIDGWQIGSNGIGIKI